MSDILVGLQSNRMKEKIENKGSNRLFLIFLNNDSPQTYKILNHIVMLAILYLSRKKNIDAYLLL